MEPAANDNGGAAVNLEAYMPGWKIVRQIGAGSFGKVYEIQKEETTGRSREYKSALKVISIPSDPEQFRYYRDDGLDERSITTIFKGQVDKILSECELLSLFRGTGNIVSYEDHFCVAHEDGCGWDILVRMELLTTLPDYVATHGVTPETVIKVGIDMCRALELCARVNIVHRDIKPQNIFVNTFTGDFKLGDFGIAREMEHTTQATRIGTCVYMAPEVFNGQPYGAASDIYSLGLVLYWMLNDRRLPFIDASCPATEFRARIERALARRLGGEALPAPQNADGLLAAIILKACAYSPQERYTDPAQLRRDLERLQQGTFCLPNNTAAFQTTELLDEPPVFSGAEWHPETAAEPNQTAQMYAETEYDPAEHASTPSTPEPTDKPQTGEKTKRWLQMLALLCAAIVLFGAVFLLKGQASDVPDVPNTEDTSNKIEDATPTTAQTESVAATAKIEDATPPTTQTENAAATAPAQVDWSDWLQDLPEHVNSTDFDIEERVLYSSRTLETTSSTKNNSMNGWELYDTATGNGDYGAWSEWSETKVSESDTRKVETETRYRYSDKETKSSVGAYITTGGWELEDTEYNWGEYGSWSAWSTNRVSETDSRRVQPKTQYRYQDISYRTQYTSYGSWSNWQTDAVTENDLTKVQTRMAYPFYYFYCYSCGRGARYPYWGITCEICGNTKITLESGTVEWFENTWDSSTSWGAGKYYQYIDGSIWWNWTDGTPTTQYRYKTRSTFEETIRGEWSDWGDTYYASSPTREVDERTVYRYQTRSQIPTYHYYRWTDWSLWSETEYKPSSTRQVETTTFYRYCDRVKQTTYYFRRWTDWSDYTEAPVEKSSTVDVKTETQFRYRSKK